MKKEISSMTILVPKDLHKKFKFAALKKEKSMTEIIIAAIEQFIEENENVQ